MMTMSPSQVADCRAHRQTSCLSEKLIPKR